MGNYELLISKLDAFIRKYYANKLLKGILVFFTSFLLFVLTVTVSEYYLYLPAWLRTSIAVLFVISAMSALVAWIVIPLTQMAKLGRVISHEQAAVIIGHHFTDVSDKLLNILQLRKNADAHSSKELIEASIDQKAKQLVTVPVVSAIDLTKNRKYLPYLLPVLLAGIFMLVAAPNVFRDASARLLQPTKSFEKPAPFNFVLKTGELKATRNSDFAIEATTEGDVLPADMAIAIGDDIIPMSAAGNNEFSYTFRNVTEPVTFRLYAAGFYSKEYILNVVQKPILKSFKVDLDYPAYTGRKDEQVKSLGDITVPAGTIVQWQLVAEHTDMISMNMGNGNSTPFKKDNNEWTSQFRFMADTSYVLVLSNKKTGVTDSFQYYVKVIPDEHPVLQLQEYRDSVSGKQILLNGNAADDYGISKVLFHYTVTNAQNQELAKKSVPLKITPGISTVFQHYFDIQDLDLQPGQKLSYYVEAWDNDGVHGSKATRSELMEYRMYDRKQLDSAINANSQQINSGLSNSAQRSDKLQDEYRGMQSRLLKSKDMDWEQQESLQDLLKMQQSMQNEMKAVQKRFEEQLQQSQQKQYSDDLKDKQESLKKQMDNLLNKELQEQMKKLQELMQKLNKEQALKTMQQLEQDNKLFKMDMERMKEMMNKMEMQMRLEDMANKMDELAKKEDALKEKTDKKDGVNAALDKEQKDIKNELDEAMKKDMKDIEELNKTMKDEKDLDDEKKLGEDAEQEMKESSEELQQNQNSKASQSQSKASQNLKQMAQSLRSAASSMDMDQLTKDIRAVRQILSNLMRLSFDQEKLMNELKDVNLASQNYVAKQQEQNRLHDNSKMIRDSLFEMSKDMHQLAANVNKETTELERNMGYTVSSIEARRISDAITRQQYVMTHANNLALMLNELLSNLLSMQSQAEKGSKGMCKNPGGKTPRPGPGQQLSDVITKQKKLGDAMAQMKAAQQKRGAQDGENGDSGKDGQGDKKKEGGDKQEYGDAEQLARMAQQQAALRKQLQELNSLLNSKGMNEIAKELREIQEEMDKNETQLVNRRLGSELLLRQREILTRLLEAEKAVREQQQDDKRSSNTAKDISRPVPAELQQYMKDRNQLTEQYKTAPPVLKPYYQQIVKDYYKLLGI
ncbi:MAG: hypothetical protein H6550_08120 [Chitinophagales bacterium]|nr:hypothetical protein [Chitinophagales bacterium]